MLHKSSGRKDFAPEKPETTNKQDVQTMSKEALQKEATDLKQALQAKPTEQSNSSEAK